MRTIAIARRIVLQLLGDRRTLAMILVAPLLVLGLLSLIFTGKDYQPRIAVVDAPPPFATRLAERGARVTELAADEADRRLNAGAIDAIFRVEAGRPHLVVDGGDPTVTRATLGVVMRLGGGEPPVVEFRHGSATMSAFDNFGPVLLGFLVFFFTFIVSGISFVRERTVGTLERMLATPVRRWEVVVGYLLGFAGVVAVQSTLIALFSVYVLGMMLVGSFVVLIAVVLLIAGSALTLGMLLSAWASNEFQVVQFIPIVVVPQIFFSGLFPLASMHPALRAIGRALPLTYAADALRAVMIRGAGLGDLGFDLAILAGCSTLFLAANVIALKKVRSL